MSRSAGSRQAVCRGQDRTAGSPLLLCSPVAGAAQRGEHGMLLEALRQLLHAELARPLHQACRRARHCARRPERRAVLCSCVCWAPQAAHVLHSSHPVAACREPPVISRRCSAQVSRGTAPWFLHAAGRTAGGSWHRCQLSGLALLRSRWQLAPPGWAVKQVSGAAGAASTPQLLTLSTPAPDIVQRGRGVDACRQQRAQGRLRIQRVPARVGRGGSRLGHLKLEGLTGWWRPHPLNREAAPAGPLRFDDLSACIASPAQLTWM